MRLFLKNTQLYTIPILSGGRNLLTTHPQHLNAPALAKNIFTHLHVEKIEGVEKRTQAAQTALLWHKIALEKEKNAIETAQFQDCKNLSEQMSMFLAYDWRSYDFYGSKDRNENYQSMMALTLKPESVYIEYLVTNPINIRSSVNDLETEKVTGAGTTLLRYAEQIASQNGKQTVSLFPLPSSTPFYKKNKFTFILKYEQGPMQKSVREALAPTTTLLSA